MRTKALIVLASITLYYSIPSTAYEAERAKNNMAHDLATCSGYYSAASFMNGLPEDAKTEYKNASNNMLLMATKLTNEKSAAARVEIAIKEMVKELDGKAENWSILINEYSELCTSVSEKPMERFEYWLKKED